MYQPTNGNFKSVMTPCRKLDFLGTGATALTGSSSMLSLPFFGLFASLVLIGTGRRTAAIAFWVASLGLLLVLLADCVHLRQLLL